MEENKTQIETQVSQLKEVIGNLENKNFRMYFFTLDTKGNPTAGIANIYEHVKMLNELGYNACILHEKNDYKLRGDENGNGVGDWLGEEYAQLPHASIEGQELLITPSDFIIIPEVFANIMEQVKGFPCKKIVFSQSYDYLLELLAVGKRWDFDFGFNDVVTTSKKQASYIKSLFPSIKTHIVPVSIPSYFKPTGKPKTPVVALLTRNAGEAAKLAKSFYLQYPIYKWVTFKELRGLSRENFATQLEKCCLAVWIDDQAGFGTFPLEAIECNTPVIGKMPNMIPEWMENVDENGEVSVKNNGVWTNTTLNISELIATYLKIWLEDAVPTDLLDAMAETRGQYSVENQKQILEDVYSAIFENRTSELKITLEKLEDALKETTNS
jgi:hypothetical protein